ncbi:unnamed protein product [Leptidea sinapis]|uniref:Uncharacterized protein n=1 Tax=Leptidea sinapis TaxID=189913 RepID=A0A5E4R2W2_9NEOP|nr:unnamed protein product [Leptidea sinapis]
MYLENIFQKTVSLWVLNLLQKYPCVMLALCTTFVSGYLNVLCKYQIISRLTDTDSTISIAVYSGFMPKVCAMKAMDD